ncbi:hypothetical protein ScalyP_jg8121 [Parmales sp. scaly parma]|nr:hypothetical protein ScalyP_jg8121 [Parmales sp. scaly parma]
MGVFGTPTSSTVDNIMGLYPVSDSSTSANNNSNHLSNVPSNYDNSSPLTTLLKFSLLALVGAGSGYTAYTNILLPKFGTREALLLYIWEGEEPEKWRMEEIMEDVLRRLAVLEKEVNLVDAGDATDAAAAAAATTSAADSSSSSAESEWETKNKLKMMFSSLSHNVDKLAADIDTVRGDKGSAIRSKKKIASTRIEQLMKKLDRKMSAMLK